MAALAVQYHQFWATKTVKDRKVAQNGNIAWNKPVNKAFKRKAIIKWKKIKVRRKIIFSFVAQGKELNFGQIGGRF